MTASDESPNRLSFTMSRELLKQIDQWRVSQPRTLSRAEAVRRLVELSLDTQSARDAASGIKRQLPTPAERSLQHQAKTISAFNGVLSILNVLVAKKLVDHKELARIHESMSRPFSGKLDEGRSLMADAQRRLDDVIGQLGRRSLRPPKAK